MSRFVLYRFTIVACLLSLPGFLNAQEMRVYTTVRNLRGSAVSEDRAPVVARSLTLFHAGKVYDYVEAAKELTIFEPAHHRAGVGVLIYDKLCRNEGIGSGALALVMQYAQTHLNLHQLYANIGTDNAASVALFTKFGFQEIGVKKQWNLVRGAFKDEGLYQYIFTK